MTKKERSPRSAWTITLALAGAASLIELGPLIALLQTGGGIVPILIAALAYQLGNALARPVALPAVASILLAVGSAAGLSIAQPGTAMWFVAMAVLSWALQTIRRRPAAAQATSRVPTVHKRLARVAGFIATGFLPLSVMAIAVGALCATTVLVEPQTRAPVEVSTNNTRQPVAALEWIMVIHQLHYFSYCYSVPVLLTHAMPDHSWTIGALFALGWISYLSAEVLWHGRIGMVNAFVAGHLFVTVTLIGLSVWSNVGFAATAMWVLTGFGGGTVFCITQFYHRLDGDPKRLESFEDLGHIGGVAVALGVTLALGWQPADLPLVGAGFAILTAIGMVLWWSTHGRFSEGLRRPITQAPNGKVTT